MTEPIDVFILAGGAANRMFPLNVVMEKSLLPINGKPVVRHIVDKIVESGVARNIGIVCLDKFRKNFEHEFRDLEVKIISSPEPVGTFNTWVDALKQVEIARTTDYVMVHYADCVTEIDYKEFIKSIECGKDGIIAITNTVKHDYSEVVIHEPTNQVRGFWEKPEIAGYTWSGIGIFKKDVFLKYKRKDIGTDFAYDIFPQMIKKEELNSYVYHGFWADVGNLNSYMKVVKSYENNNQGG